MGIRTAKLTATRSILHSRENFIGCEEVLRVQKLLL